MSKVRKRSRSVKYVRDANSLRRRASNKAEQKAYNKAVRMDARNVVSEQLAPENRAMTALEEWDEWNNYKLEMEAEMDREIAYADYLDRCERDADEDYLKEIEIDECYEDYYEFEDLVLEATNHRQRGNQPHSVEVSLQCWQMRLVLLPHSRI